MVYCKLHSCALGMRTSKQVLKQVVIVLVIVCVRVVQALNNICGRGTVHASGAPEFTTLFLIYVGFIFEYMAGCT